jgi:hypothetical protein
MDTVQANEDASPHWGFERESDIICCWKWMQVIPNPVLWQLNRMSQTLTVVESVMTA